MEKEKEREERERGEEMEKKGKTVEYIPPCVPPWWPSESWLEEEHGSERADGRNTMVGTDLKQYRERSRRVSWPGLAGS